LLSSNSVSEVEKWSQFIEDLQKTKKIPKPFCAIDTLVREYLWQNHSTRSVLDVGCETGKNAICLIQAGHNVTLLDIAPNAIQYTQENLKKLELDHGVINRITGKIETLDSKYCPFKAVVGTYVFSYIASGVFQQVMKENVLGRIEPGGYFAGGFFGMEHDWAQKPELSILTQEKLKELFESMGFLICEMKEKKEVQSIISCGQQMFHTFEVIAQRSCNP